MPQLHETQTGRHFFEGTLPRIAKALEAIAAGVKADRDGLSPRELHLALEAVEYYVGDVKTENDSEYRELLSRLRVMTGQAPPTR